MNNFDTLIMKIPHSCVQINNALCDLWLKGESVNGRNQFIDAPTANLKRKHSPEGIAFAKGLKDGYKIKCSSNLNNGTLTNLDNIDSYFKALNDTGIARFTNLDVILAETRVLRADVTYDVEDYNPKELLKEVGSLQGCTTHKTDYTKHGNIYFISKEKPKRGRVLIYGKGAQSGKPKYAKTVRLEQQNTSIKQVGVSFGLSSTPYLIDVLSSNKQPLKRELQMIASNIPLATSNKITLRIAKEFRYLLIEAKGDLKLAEAILKKTIMADKSESTFFRVQDDLRAWYGMQAELKMLPEIIEKM